MDVAGDHQTSLQLLNRQLTRIKIVRCLLLDKSRLHHEDVKEARRRNGDTRLAFGGVIRTETTQM